MLTEVIQVQEKAYQNTPKCTFYHKIKKTYDSLAYHVRYSSYCFVAPKSPILAILVANIKQQST
jgi:hypothetical protein